MPKTSNFFAIVVIPFGSPEFVTIVQSRESFQVDGNFFASEESSDRESGRAGTSKSARMLRRKFTMKQNNVQHSI